MDFAVPSALGLGVLVVPVVALFLVRPRPRPHRVATLMFWQASAPAQRRRVAWGRLRNPLALAFALGALGLIALAAASPYLTPGGDTPARVVLVLDNSLGMKATDVTPTRLDRAADLARRYIGGLRPGQTAAVVAAGGRPHVACGLTDDPGLLRRAIAAVGPTDAPRRLDAAVELARPLAAGGKIVVLSGAPTRPAGDDVVWVPIGTPVGNLAVTVLRPRRVNGSAEFELLVEVASAASGPTDATLELTLNGELLDVHPLHLKAGETWRRVLRKEAKIGGTIRAKLSPGDSLPADDEAWAILPPTELMPVVLSSIESTPGGEAVRAALEELSFVRKPVVVAMDPDGLRAGAVAVFYRKLPKLLPAGPSLVIDPPGGSALWALGDPVADPDVRVKDPTSPLVARLTLPRDAVGRPRGIRPLADARIAVEAASGEPVLIDFPRGPGQGRVVMLAADLEGGGLRFSPTFVALIGNVLQHLAGVKADLPDVPMCGETVTVELPPGVSYELRPPTGPFRPLAGAGPTTIGPLDRAGVWAVGLADGSSEVWKVATRPAGAVEVDLRPAAADSGERSAVGYFPPWMWLAVAAVVLLAVEWVAYHRRWIE